MRSILLITALLLSALLAASCGDADSRNIGIIEGFVVKVMESDLSACDSVAQTEKDKCRARIEKLKKYAKQKQKELDSYEIKSLRRYSGDDNLRRYKGELLVKLKDGKTKPIPIDITMRNVDGEWKIIKQ